MMLPLILFLFAAPAGSIDLLAGNNLDAWQIVGGGIWSVLKDGTVAGQSDPKQPFKDQSWIYTKREFGEFDLSMEYFLQLGSNSGVSIGDRSRARYAAGPERDPNRTPSHIGYEINLDNGINQGFDISGSVYLITQAKRGPQKDTDWNRLEIGIRRNLITVKINGQLVAESAGLPERPKAGPIGLQLHDHTDFVMFRNIHVREITPAPAP